MKRARWTSAKYVCHQLRVVPDNAYNPGAEPEDNKSDSDLVVSHEDFFLMIRPVLGSMLRTDAMAAILKRSAIIIFGKTHITYRFPSDHETSGVSHQVAQGRHHPGHFEAQAQELQGRCAWEAAPRLQVSS